MRKTAIIVLAGLVLLMHCAGSKPSVENNPDIPDFVLNPPQEAGILFGTGIANLQNLQLAKETADIRARREIASALSQKISALLKEYLGQTGIGSTADVKELSKSIRHAISDIELVGVTIEKRRYGNGRIYSLARYLIDDSMKKLVTDAVNKSFSSKEALLSQFREKQGFEELDKQLEKMKATQR
jgi:hypothetical protein